MLRSDLLGRSRRLFPPPVTQTAASIWRLRCEGSRFASQGRRSMRLSSLTLKHDVICRRAVRWFALRGWQDTHTKIELRALSAWKFIQQGISTVHTHFLTSLPPRHTRSSKRKITITWAQQRNLILALTGYQSTRTNRSPQYGRSTQLCPLLSTKPRRRKGT